MRKIPDYKPPLHLAAPGTSLVSISQAAKILGVGVTWLRDRSDVFPHIVDPDTGWRWYDKDALGKQAKRGWKSFQAEKVKGRHETGGGRSEIPPPPKTPSLPAVEYSGPIAAQIFEELDTGKTPSQVVKLAKIHPEIVLEVHKRWLAMQGGIALDKAQMERIAALPLKGDADLSTPEGVVSALERACAPVKCARCSKASARVCVPCSIRVGADAASTPAALAVSARHTGGEANGS